MPEHVHLLRVYFFYAKTDPVIQKDLDHRICPESPSAGETFYGSIFLDDHSLFMLKYALF
ncbi:hypothetical protein SAMN05444955_101237 [Lihuaxuella thermophila]|uniref:Uncharacterized protein n=1 Tax=Lihuaxuella thermophila TaxID=1173111 RepID=A0A1H8AM20_9BACL|nr:hypothetical protein SAMN05444955_101237 [Lihuaxuella thermophila]